MPYGDAYNYVPDNSAAYPYSYVYYPAYGWTWLSAPWVGGWGACPYFGAYGYYHYGWYHPGYHWGGYGWGRYGWGAYGWGHYAWGGGYPNGYHGGYHPPYAGGHAVVPVSHGGHPVAPVGHGGTVGHGGVPVTHPQANANIGAAGRYAGNGYYGAGMHGNVYAAGGVHSVGTHPMGMGGPRVYASSGFRGGSVPNMGSGYHGTSSFHAGSYGGSSFHGGGAAGGFHGGGGGGHMGGGGGAHGGGGHR